MKRFMKVCGITALILIVLGIILGGVAGSVRGRIAIEDTVRAITGGRINLELGAPGAMGELAEEITDGITEGISEAGQALQDIPDNEYFDIDDRDIFDKYYSIMSGDVEKYSLGTGIGELDVEIGGCSLVIVESPDEEFYLDAKKVKKFQGYVKGDTLHIKALRSEYVRNEGNHGEITLYIPANYTFREADLEVGAGVIEIGALSAGDVSLTAGAGKIEADFIQADDLDVSAGAGAVSVDDMQVRRLSGETGVGYMFLGGQIDGDVDMECAMGSLEMSVRGAAEDFNYKISCGMGNLELAGESYSGLAREKQIDNRASKSMNLECAMGSIEVYFDR